MTERVRLGPRYITGILAIFERMVEYPSLHRREEAMRPGTLLLLAMLAMVESGLPALAEDLPIRPDDVMTPGAVASTDPIDVCGIVGGLTYSKRHRHTSSELKREVYEGYHIERAEQNFEIDHRVPVCLGGADVRENLWPQPGSEHPSYHDKDALEDQICRRVCRDQSMTLEEGQAIFLGDWIAGYEQIFGEKP
jgi:hypothetical protein